MMGVQQGRRGCLIVFEGIDRVGKSTQADLLVKRLIENGSKAELMRFPDRTTKIGKTINEYLTSSSEDKSWSDHSIHLLFSANRWEKMREMEEKLLGGSHLVVDRYAFSGVAFTSAKPNFSLNWCKQSDAGIIKPDRVFFLQMPPKSASERGDYGNERYEKLDFQERVKEQYSKLKDDSWKVIDAVGSIPSIHELIYSDCLNVIQSEGNSGSTELPKLWV